MTKMNAGWYLVFRSSRSNKRDRKTMTREETRVLRAEVICQITGVARTGTQAHAISRTPNCVSEKGPFELGFIG